MFNDILWYVFNLGYPYTNLNFQVTSVEADDSGELV